MGKALLDVHDLAMHWPRTGVSVLRGASLSVGAGEFTVILGANGCGKTTFLKCIVRLLTPTGGSIAVAGHEMASLSGIALQRARLDIAMVSQHANLIKRRSVMANVITGALGRYPDWRTSLGALPEAELSRAYHHLQTVGLADLALQRAGTLSGGQAQRAAIARALAQQPKVLLADEPVASLDPEAAEDILRLLQRLAHDDQLAVLCVLHQPALALRYADRVVGFREGAIAFDLPTGAVSGPMISSLYGTDVAA
ncbi:MAG TPA: ATP-binding cassette domain-containing protein [Candidatus Acidoferrales bacterium]|nr:ATP-binding cassette domain-containing protein [Candidatus Acidoferrales bacterium]